LTRSWPISKLFETRLNKEIQEIENKIIRTVVLTVNGSVSTALSCAQTDIDNRFKLLESQIKKLFENSIKEGIERWTRVCNSRLDDELNKHTAHFTAVDKNIKRLESHRYTPSQEDTKTHADAMDEPQTR